MDIDIYWCQSKRNELIDKIIMITKESDNYGY